MSVGLVATVALSAASMALQMTRKIEGPRLDDLKVSVADYGTPLNYFYGIRRFDAVPIIWSEDIREEKHRNKTKGGKYNDYKYFGTWAVAVADHEIAGITRIWFDKHLIYDATGAGPITPFVSTGRFGRRTSVSDNIRFYFGTEDQEPDPRMLATVEAAQGEGSCPAYRGVAYIVFEEMPLEKVGNRIPQISVEAVSVASPSYPVDAVDALIRVPTEMEGFSFSPDGAYMIFGLADAIEVWDAAARAPIAGFSYSGTITNQDIYGLSRRGVVYSIGTGNFVYSFSPDGIGGAALFAEQDTTLGMSHCRVVLTGGDTELLFAVGNTHIQSLNLDLGGAFSDEDVIDWLPKVFITDSYGDVWALGPASDGTGGNKTELVMKRVYATGDGPAISYRRITGLTSVGYNTSPAAFHADGHFIVTWGNQQMYRIEDEGLTVATSRSFGASFGGPNLLAKIYAVPPGASSFWIDGAEYSSADLTTIRTVDFGDWDHPEGVQDTIYDSLNHALIGVAGLGATKLQWLYLDRIGSPGVLLSDIVADVSGRVGIDPADVDASDLTQIVKGYSWTQGAGKDILEPLLDAYDSIARPHDFGIEYLRLGDSSGGSILTAQFVRKGDDPRYKVIIAQDTDLPRRVTFSFADVDKDQQTNSVVVQRPLDSVDGVREVSVDMTTLAVDVDEARHLAERWFRRRWFSRETMEMGLTAQYLALEPGDVRTLYRDDEPATFRLEKSTLAADGVIGCLWTRDDPTIAILSGEEGATMDGRTDAVILVPILSKGFVLDIPLVRDAHNAINPLLYYGSGPYGAGTWPGALIYQSLDSGSEYDTELASVPSTAGLTWGYSTDALAVANPNLWDRGNSVNVIIKNGTLSSATEAACDGNPSLNLALLDDEIFQFASATLEGDGSYTLTGLKRGRRGTEWAIDSHAAGDRFVLLDAVAAVDMGASDIGDVLYFKAITVGRDFGFPFTVGWKPASYGIASFDSDPYEGRSLRPYAVAHIEATLDPATSDWVISFVRRSRIGGSWVGGTSVPVGETTETYKLELISRTLTGDFEDSIYRTITSSSSPITYTAAMQTTDTATPGDGFNFRLAQWSDTVGRGFSRFYRCSSAGVITEIDHQYVDLTREP